MLYTDMRPDNEQPATPMDAIKSSENVQKSLKNSNIWKISDSQSSDAKLQRKRFALSYKLKLT